MLINKFDLRKILRDEFDGEGEDLGGAPTPDGNGESEEPSYLFGDVTADEAAEQFGWLRSLPSQLREMEERTSGAVSPVMEQLKSLSEQIGSQPAFNPTLEKFSAALKEYDPDKADGLIAALKEDLSGSFNSTPLSAEVLQPLISPMLQQQQEAMVNQFLPSLIDLLPFDANSIVNRDPANPDNVLEPKTDLQKDFAKWWEQADAPTRKALGTLGLPYFGALQKFGKWRAELIRKKGEAAGEASARLGNAAQKPAGSRRAPTSGGLRTEADGFAAIFSEKD